MTPCETVYPQASVWSLRRVRQDPLAFLQQLACQGDVVPFTLAGHQAFLLNHPDHVEDVLVTNHAKFAKPDRFRRASALLGNGLLTAEGPLHRQRRQALQPSFNPSRMDAYSAIVVGCAEQAQSRLEDGQTVDMAAAMRDLALAIIGSLLFGRDLSALAPEIHRAMTEAGASMDPLLSVLAPGRRLRPARDRLRDIVDSLIDAHCGAAAESNGLVRALYRAENHVVTEQLRDDVCTLFVAGHETIANALTWTWLLIAENGEAEGRLHDELNTRLGDGRLPSFEDFTRLTYAGWVLAESLRLCPPSWIITRRALDEHEVGGTLIPAGALAIVSQHLLHRDHRFFPDPLAFRPERWDLSEQARPKLAFFPFGAGPRSCIGQGFATMEGVLVLACLGRRWRFRAAGPVGKVETDLRVTLRPRGPVHMTPESRS